MSAEARGRGDSALNSFVASLQWFLTLTKVADAPQCLEPGAGACDTAVLHVWTERLSADLPRVKEFPCSVTGGRM